MKQSFLIAAILCIQPLMAATEGTEDSPVTKAEVQKIIEALPTTCTAIPKQPRKVLIFSRAWGYKHSSIPYGKEAFARMGLKTKAFETVVSDDDGYFEIERLQEFDAVVLNNCNNEIFLPEHFKDLPPVEQKLARVKDQRLKRNLRNFIAEGHGLVAIHAGIASFREWPEFGVIMGARFDNHPWNAGSTVTLKVENPDHPVTRTCCPERFQITDEIYQFKEYSRTHLQVLLSLDTSLTKMNKGKALHRSDNDYALSWVKSYGRGRVFYGALGHQHDIFWNPRVLQHYLDGLQFVLGDLEATTTPDPR